MPIRSPALPRSLKRSGFTTVPTVFVAAGPNATKRFLEFFTVNIRNEHTREAYFRAALHFSDWCDQHGVALADIQPMHVAAYIESLTKKQNKNPRTGKPWGRSTIKQHLAAIRMLFDWLVIGQVVPFNPAQAVRGPKHKQQTGTTPHLEADEVRLLLESIDVTTIAGLRDRALVSVALHSFGRISATLAMDAEDYYRVGAKRWYFRLKEKNGTVLEIPAHTLAQEHLDAHLTRRGLDVENKRVAGRPLFPSLDRNRRLTDRRLHRTEALLMIKRRAKHAGLSTTICNHSTRATGITNFLLNGGSLEDAQRIAGHASARTTKGYDHTDKALTLNEINRINYFGSSAANTVTSKTVEVRDV